MHGDPGWRCCRFLHAQAGRLRMIHKEGSRRCLADGSVVKKADMSTGLLMASAKAPPSDMAPWRPRAKSKGPRRSPCWLGILSGPKFSRLSFEQHSSQYLAFRGTRRTSRKQDLSTRSWARSRSRVQRHRPSSLCFWRGRWLHSRVWSPQLRWAEVSCQVLGNGGQQGCRCETTKSLSRGHRSVAVFLVQCRE